MSMVNEKLIQHHMKTLKLTREEAIQLIKEDEEVDRMGSVKELEADMTPEQRKASKDARKTTSMNKAYKFDVSKREKKKNPQKKEIIDCLIEAIKNLGGDVTEVTNEEREFLFNFDNVNYKITMAVPRNKS